MNDREIILHLSLIDGIGPTVINTIIAYKPATVLWRQLYSLDRPGWHQLGVTDKQATLLMAGLSDSGLLEKELSVIERHAIQWTTILDHNYPTLLKHINVPPPILWWYGTLPHNNMIAVVGSRDANSYAERHITALVDQLVAQDFCIVSGGALGADTMAHKAALSAGGSTVVVLGSGICHFAPRTNARLFERIIEQSGAVVSIFPSMTTPHPGYFPARNRVISGLSCGTIVAQAGEKSGARITAYHALEQGRDVFALPGSLDDPLSTGCHTLIQEGAQLVMTANDIFAAYGMTQKSFIADESKGPFDNVNKKKHPVYNSNAQEYTPLHKKIIDACLHAQSIDRLAQECELDLSQMQKELFELQMNGMVEQDFTGMWKSL